MTKPFSEVLARVDAELDAMRIPDRELRPLIVDLRACLVAADELADLYEADSRLEVMLPVIENYRAARAKVKP